MLKGEPEPSETGRGQGDNKRNMCFSDKGADSRRQQFRGRDEHSNIPESVQRGCANPSDSRWREHRLFELLGNFSPVSKWIVRNEDKRKVH